MIGVYCLLRLLRTKLIKCHFNVCWDPLWAWVCCALDRQDAIKELFKCVLRVSGQGNGGPMLTAVALLAEFSILRTAAQPPQRYSDNVAVITRVLGIGFPSPSSSGILSGTPPPFG